MCPAEDNRPFSRYFSSSSFFYLISPLSLYTRTTGSPVCVCIVCARVSIPISWPPIGFNSHFLKLRLLLFFFFCPYSCILFFLLYIYIILDSPYKIPSQFPSNSQRNKMKSSIFFSFYISLFNLCYFLFLLAFICFPFSSLFHSLYRLIPAE